MWNRKDGLDDQPDGAGLSNQSKWPQHRHHFERADLERLAESLQVAKHCVRCISSERLSVCTDFSSAKFVVWDRRRVETFAVKLGHTT